MSRKSNRLARLQNQRNIYNNNKLWVGTDLLVLRQKCATVNGCIFWNSVELWHFISNNAIVRIKND